MADYCLGVRQTDLEDFGELSEMSRHGEAECVVGTGTSDVDPRAASSPWLEWWVFGANQMGSSRGIDTVAHESRRRGDRIESRSGQSQLKVEEETSESMSATWVWEEERRGGFKERGG